MTIPILKKKFQLRQKADKCIVPTYSGNYNNRSVVSVFKFPSNEDLKKMDTCHKTRGFSAKQQIEDPLIKSA